MGLGRYAELIMSKFAECDQSRLAALVSGTPEKLARFGEKYGVPESHRYSYADFDRIRDNPDVDIVYVILPNAMHAEYTVRAAKAGKHVMCEKPMAVSVAECRTMIAACRAAGRKLMIGYRSRFEPHNRLAIDLARKGFVGPTRIITADHGFNAQPNQWRLDRTLSGGGSLMDIGIYSLNATRYLTGEEPVEVSAIESTDRRDPRFRTVEDRISFLLRFPSGSRRPACRAIAPTTICTACRAPMAGSSWNPPPPMRGRRCGSAAMAEPRNSRFRQQGPARRTARPFRRMHRERHRSAGAWRGGAGRYAGDRGDLSLRARGAADHPGLTPRLTSSKPFAFQGFQAHVILARVRR